MNKKTIPILILLILTTVLLSACSQGGFNIVDVWARPGFQGDTSAAYFTIQNNTAQDEALLSASSDIAEKVEFHHSMMVEGVMKMEPQNSIPIPSQSVVELEPGDFHVMFINLAHDLEPGDSFELTLNFKNAGEMTIDVKVREP